MGHPCRAGLSRGKEAGPGSPPRLPPWCLCPLPHPPQPWGAELSNSSYAAWPVYRGVSGQGCPQGGGPPHLQGHRNRERLRTWGEGARQSLNNHSNPFLLLLYTSPHTHTPSTALSARHTLVHLILTTALAAGATITPMLQTRKLIRASGQPAAPRPGLGEWVVFTGKEGLLTIEHLKDCRVAACAARCSPLFLPLLE